MAVIGAIIGEFFAGYGATRYGLGYVIMQATNQLKTNELFAAVIASTALGMAVFTIVNIVGATVLSRWYHA
jgi:NitT/TauT family transport system permease protein